MIKRLRMIPKRWKRTAVILLVLGHAVPLLLAVPLILPEDQNVLQQSIADQKVSFVQADSRLSVRKAENKDQIPPQYHIRLDTISKTIQSIPQRSDLTLLFQDGILIGKSKRDEKNTDTVLQNMEAKSKYNHLFQAVSFHSGLSAENTSQQVMSYDYLYVSATKYGGIQSFHQPETTQHQNWKDIIDRSIHHQMNYEWEHAFEEFEINPDDFYMFPLTQLPLYSQKEELPGIPREQAYQVISEIWNAIDTHLVSVDGKDKKTEGSSLPLILIAKNGTRFQILYRTSDGYYHQLTHTLEVLK